MKKLAGGILALLCLFGSPPLAHAETPVDKPDARQAAPAPSNEVVQSAGVTWYINAQGIFEAELPGRSDGFDITALRVDGVVFANPGASSDLTANTYTSDDLLLSGLTVRMQLYFSTNRPVARSMFSFSNSTGAPITIVATNFVNYGSDGDTVVENTSDGNNAAANSDRWVVSSDGAQSDPVIGLVRFGPGTPAVTPNALNPIANGNDENEDNYTITIPAGQTRRLVIFYQLATDVAAANSAIAVFDSNAALEGSDLLSGLSDVQKAEIVNFDLGAAGPAAPVPTLSEWAMLLFGTVLAGGAALYIQRRRLTA